MQLPFYFYLLSQGDLHYELVGSFIQQVMPKDLYNKEDKKTIESRSELDMLYRGYIVDGYQDQVIIRNKKNAITVEQTKEIIQQVDNLLKQAIKNIHNGDFKINPKFIENNVNPCKYCPYLSICYKKVTDYVLIDLKNKGGEENDQ